MSSPVGEYRTIVDDSGNASYVNRLLVGTACTGLLRVEWVAARYGQVIPVNWSMVNTMQFMSGYYPLRYQVADAQNLIVKAAIEGDFEWCLLWEHDVLAPPDALRRLDDYIREKDTPVVSGLYYTRARPSDPLIFHGRGTGPYLDWEMGDKVWVDGVPTGFLLIHTSVLRKMWDDSETYQVRAGHWTRRVFHTPRDLVVDPENADQLSMTNGTSDLWWCSRVMEENYLVKAGWEAFEGNDRPFLVDTNIFCRHINPDGEQFP